MDQSPFPPQSYTFPTHFASPPPDFPLALPLRHKSAYHSVAYGNYLVNHLFESPMARNLSNLVKSNKSLLHNYIDLTDLNRFVGFLPARALLNRVTIASKVATAATAAHFRMLTSLCSRSLHEATYPREKAARSAVASGGCSVRSAVALLSRCELYLNVVAVPPRIGNRAGHLSAIDLNH